MHWRTSLWPVVTVLASCGIVRAQAPAARFNGLDMHLGNLSRLSDAQSRSISPENFTGEKGQGRHGHRRHRARTPRGTWARAGRSRPRCGIKAKSTFTLAEIDGPGAIQQIWMTPAPIDKTRHYILRFYWDGETEPSVEVPAGRLLRLRLGQVLPDQFAAGLRQSRAAPSTATGRCRFARRRRSRWRTSTTRTWSLYYQVNYTLTDVPADAAYFHAQFRRVHKLRAEERCTRSSTACEGKGQYVGTYLAWEVHSPGWWGEGEIKFFMDGDKEFPTICGTGTEDYFCGSYNFENQETQALPDLQHALHRAGPGAAAGHASIGPASGSGSIAGTSPIRCASRRT